MNEEQEGFRVMALGDGRDVNLAMESLWLTGRVLPVGARLVAVHGFRSAEKRPTEVVYSFGLPRDAALRRFKVVGEGFQVRSELRPAEEAREAYEEGIQEGHLSALSRVYRDGRVNLSLGNIRPGELVRVYLEILAGVNLRDNGYRFRFPFTLAPCYHRSARSVAVPGGLEMELPSGEFSDLILPPWMNGDEKLHRVGFDLAVVWPGGAKELGSPSHRVQVVARGSGVSRLASAKGGDVPNRDLVVDVKGQRCGALCYGGDAGSSSADGQGSRAFAVVVPSACLGESGDTPRNMLFLLDRSGSMDGVPLRQAKQALLAGLGVLEADDRFNLLAFDSSLEWFERELVPATDENRARARVFLDAVEARGGTELGPALREALRQVGSNGTDVFVLTDGQVAATEDIVSATRDRGVRVHCLGIGSASQDRFLAMLAENSGGVSEFVMPRERVDLKALELFGSAGRTAGQEVEVDAEGIGNLRWVVPPKRHVYAGFPLLLWGEGSAVQAFNLRVRWQTGGERKEAELECKPTADTDTVRLLQGARLITSIEARCGMGLDRRGRMSREAKRWQKKLEEAGLEYGLANQALSLVAVVERQGDDASQVPLTQVVPVGMPEDLAPDAYVAVLGETNISACFRAAPRRPRGFVQRLYQGSRRSSATSLGQMKYRLSGRLSPSDSSEEDAVVQLMGELQSDGGLPGSSPVERLLRTAALLALLRLGDHEWVPQLLRSLGAKIIRFLQSNLSELDGDNALETVELVLGMVDRDETLDEGAGESVQRIARGQFENVADGWARLRQALSAGAVP